MNNTLKVGDKVMWRGAWGNDEPKEAYIRGIQITNGSKYGDDVNQVSWDKVRDREVVVDLDNGHWAYGGQLSKIKREDKDLEYYKNNAEEDYITTPISVLRYITELESKIN
jgi:hypothetical protein